MRRNYNIMVLQSYTDMSDQDLTLSAKSTI